MTFSKTVARLAFEGAAIKHSRELRTSGYMVTEDHAKAINEVVQNYAEFCSLIRTELGRWRLVKMYFGRLVDIRLTQDAILASEFISSLLDDNNEVEERLKRIHSRVKNVENLTKNIAVNKSENAGLETDEIALDLWNEIFVMDFLLHKLTTNFENLEKVVRQKDQPKIDLTGELAQLHYAIEVTRLRKRDFVGQTFPTMYEAINDSENMKSLRYGIANKLKTKNEQISKFCANDERTYERRLLVIKTSQWEYQDARQVVLDRTERLFASGNYTSIDEVMLIYDINDYYWIK